MHVLVAGYVIEYDLNDFMFLTVKGTCRMLLTLKLRLSVAKGAVVICSRIHV